MSPLCHTAPSLQPTAGGPHSPSATASLCEAHCLLPHSCMRHHAFIISAIVAKNHVHTLPHNAPCLQPPQADPAAPLLQPLSVTRAAVSLTRARDIKHPDAPALSPPPPSHSQAEPTTPAPAAAPAAASGVAVCGDRTSSGLGPLPSQGTGHSSLCRLSVIIQALRCTCPWCSIFLCANHSCRLSVNFPLYLPSV